MSNGNPRETFDAQSFAAPPDGLSAYEQIRADAGHCLSNREGDCNWSECPQLRDRKPTCPRYVREEDD